YAALRQEARCTHRFRCQFLGFRRCYHSRCLVLYRPHLRSLHQSRVALDHDLSTVVIQHRGKRAQTSSWNLLEPDAWMLSLRKSELEIKATASCPCCVRLFGTVRCAVRAINC